MIDKKKTQALFDNLINKSLLKQEIYQKTLDSFNMLKTGMIDLVEKYKAQKSEDAQKIAFKYKDRSEFEAEIKFAGDTLVFMMHTNVFEFPRNHEVMKTPYIKKDNDRSYCGIINIFNFLSDSFKYNRVNDTGYLIGRIFINKDMHYFIEGKREIGFLYNSFGNSVMDQEVACNILESAIQYTVNFDLLTPPYDNLKEVTVQEFISAIDSMRIKTGKRLGFKFQADIE
ncbi:MAG: hypothetical protein GXO89_09035 [Chlorobi bacterium]|nr:hypothetical protein [Chlorobiota bacterium]